MILQEHKHEAGISKLKRKDYSEFKRVVQLQSAFEKALKYDDYWNSRHYDREIQKVFKRCGVTE